jgi:hypothetical protein
MVFKRDEQRVFERWNQVIWIFGLTSIQFARRVA